MSDLAVRVEGLSKIYQIGRTHGYKTLRDSVVEIATAPFRRLRSIARRQSNSSDDESIWALKNVSFEVKRGEVLGIIGRNGAGKSTLLKILSRITDPTDGYADIHGRVGSLLEVGTGFHPELTGRENIQLNGAILGMKRAEIVTKFDEIVAFAEVEKFIDTPVKRYSSGMYLRLAFAVAAHLEPEILVVDEVLAVGDVQFQKKCLGKMRDVAKKGRTVLFVSHNMGAISRLCNTAAVLSHGEIVAQGPATETVHHYLKSTQEEVKASLSERQDRAGSGEMRIEEIWMEDGNGYRTDSVRTGDDLLLVFRYRCQEGWVSPRAIFKFVLQSEDGTEVGICSTGFVGNVSERFEGEGCFYCKMPRLPLAEGDYRLHYTIDSKQYAHIDYLENSFVVHVIRGDYFGTGISYSSPKFYLQHHWQLIKF